MSLSIRILQVKHGDSLFLECQQGDNKGIIVVDGGPQSSNRVFKTALSQYPLVDLLVLTHYDEDHIGGILSYFRSCRSENKPLRIKEIWANCASSIDYDDNKELSAKHAVKLSNILQEYVDKGEIIWRSDIREGVNADLGFAKISVVSPTEEVLVMTLEGIKKEEEEEDLDLAAHSRQDLDLKYTLEELSQNKKIAPDFKVPNHLANASSIAFFLECEGSTILMLGDSYPQNIVRYLTTTDSFALPLRLDYVKVSHHGSRNNISNDLLDLIECQNYIFSTNGGKGVACHPDREAIANIVCHPKRDKTKVIRLFFNYGLEHIERCGTKFINENDPLKYNFEIRDNTILL